MEDTKEHKRLSGYLIKEHKQSELMTKKVQQIKQKVAVEFENSQKHIQMAEDNVEKMIKNLENSAKTSETWIYIDMDMFYASIEIRDDPSLADKPVAVTNGSIISTANYVARRYGVKSSMPEFKALKLCEDLVLISQNMEKYKNESLKIKSIFKQYDPDFEELGIDEAGLCVTNVLRRKSLDHDSGREALAQEIRHRIFLDTQLTSSAGIACNKMLGKVCSKVNKPNGQFYIKPENIRNFMKTVEVSSASGITRNEAKLLKMLGIQTCGDILKKKLELFFGLEDQFFKNCLKTALGIGETSHTLSKKEKKSISVCKSFEPIDNESFLEEKLSEITNQIDQELKRKHLKGKGLEVNIKTFAYENRCRREVTKTYFSTGAELQELATTLLRLFFPIEPIRSIQVKIWNLKPNVGKKAVKPQQKLKKYEASEFENLFLNQSVRPAQTFQPESKTSSIRVMRFRCEKCGDWLTLTGSEMNQHTGKCTGFLSSNHRSS
jgi:DNA polymerase kappa